MGTHRLSDSLGVTVLHHPMHIVSICWLACRRRTAAAAWDIAAATSSCGGLHRPIRDDCVQEAILFMAYRIIIILG